MEAGTKRSSQWAELEAVCLITDAGTARWAVTMGGRGVGSNEPAYIGQETGDTSGLTGKSRGQS